MRRCRVCDPPTEAYMAKSCPRCRGPRACLYCGGRLGERQSKCCDAEACKKAYRLDRQAKAQERNKKRYAEDPVYRESILARNAAWRAVPENRAWMRARDAEWYAIRANREKRIAQAGARATARRAHKKASMVIPFTAEQLRRRLSMYTGCWICGIDSWDEIDHVKPIARGGPHILANLRPACRNCNRRKSATWPFPTSRKV